MSNPAPDLLSDPVFQLNLVLWLVQPVPEGSPVSPVLAYAGYGLLAVGRRITPPGTIRRALVKVAGSDAPPVPDVLIAHQHDPTILLFECKARGFGVGSSSSRQAVKLLAIGADLAAPLGLASALPRPGHLVYLTVQGQKDDLARTLETLVRTLEQAGLASASQGVMGLERRNDGVWLEPRPGGDPWPAPVAARAMPVRVVQTAPDDDPRPLYLIPWDPGVTQTEEEAAWCRALLATRVINEAISRVGQTFVPGSLVLTMADLFHDATFGVSARWYSKDLAILATTCRRTVQKALKPLEKELGLMAGASPERLHLGVASEELRKRTIDALQAADPIRALDASGDAQLFDPDVAARGEP